jgi:methionyl-tRNA synthetase
MWELVGAANKYLVETEPWALAKDADRRDELGAVLYTAAETLRILAVLVSPIMPQAAARLWSQLGLDELRPLDEQRLPAAAGWGGLPPGTRTAKGPSLFPRLDG